MLKTHNPEIIIIAAGDNQFLEGDLFVMGKEDIYEEYKAAPNVKIISNHIEAVIHWTFQKKN